MGANIDHFKDLSFSRQQDLRDYITDNFAIAKRINPKYSAYGLKQSFTSQFVDGDQHVTSQCFMEAMLAAGFEAKLVPGGTEPNWNFNAKLRKR